MVAFKTQITNRVCPTILKLCFVKTVYITICVCFSHKINIIKTQKKYYEITMHKLNNKNILQIIIFNYNNELYFIF